MSALLRQHVQTRTRGYKLSFLGTNMTAVRGRKRFSIRFWN